MESKTTIRKGAIELHHGQAKLFADWYDVMEDGSYYDAFTYGRKQLLSFLYHFLKEHIQKGASVLDVGCGSGHVVKRLREYGYQLKGLEPAKGMREAAKKVNPRVEIVDGTADSLPFADASFDAVLAIEVFRYLHESDCQAGYREAFRVLKPGGYFIFTMQNRYCLDGFPLYYFFKRVFAALFRIPVHYDHFTTPAEIQHTLRTVLGDEIEHMLTRGVIFAPFHIPYKALRLVMSRLARFVEPFDKWISSQRWHDPFAGNLIVIVKKRG